MAKGNCSRTVHTVAVAPSNEVKTPSCCVSVFPSLLVSMASWIIEIFGFRHAVGAKLKHGWQKKHNISLRICTSALHRTAGNAQYIIKLDARYVETMVVVPDSIPCPKLSTWG